MEEKKNIYKLVSQDTMLISMRLFNATTNFYFNHSDAEHGLGDLRNRGEACVNIFIILGDCLHRVNEFDLAIKALGQAFQLSEFKIELVINCFIYPFENYKEIAKVKIQEYYWEQNNAQYKSLNDRKALLQEQIDEIEKTSRMVELRKITAEIENKEKAKKNLGFFRNKEKKVLQEQIKELHSKLIQLEAEHKRLDGAIYSEMETIVSKLNIDVEHIIKEIDIN